MAAYPTRWSVVPTGYDEAQGEPDYSRDELDVRYTDLLAELMRLRLVRVARRRLRWSTRRLVALHGQPTGCGQGPKLSRAR